MKPATPPPGARIRDAWCVAVASQKGGVGKTTITLGLAAVTADANGRALVVDVDRQRSADEIAADGDFGFDFAAETDPGRLAKLRTVRDYDTIFVDCPGSLDGDEVLAGVLASADLVVIPMVPEPASVTPTLTTAAFADAHGVPYLILLNQVDPLRGTGPVESAWAALDAKGLPRFQSLVRRYVAYPQAQANRQMITAYRGDRSWGNAAGDMRRVHAELLLQLGRLDQDRR